MFKTFRIAVLTLILFMVAVGNYLSRVRSTDWDNPLYIKVYPINADGSDVADRHIDALRLEHFADVESFLSREARRYGKDLDRPVRMLLGDPVAEQPPDPAEATSVLGVMLWSLEMRWWAGKIGRSQDNGAPDVRMFVRYHAPDRTLPLDNSVGLQKGMIGIVNGYAGRRKRQYNNLVIAHEFLHTLGASDKYNPADGQPLEPHGIAEPDRSPLYPQRYAEIMGGRVAIAGNIAEVPASLNYVLIGPATALEIGLR